LIDAAYECGVKRFINTSSYETIYQDPENSTVFSESGMANKSGKDKYVYGKIVAENFIKTWQEKHKGS
jgi:nucleoside-diphosphate-sugar epimerase